MTQQFIGKQVRVWWSYGQMYRYNNCTLDAVEQTVERRRVAVEVDGTRYPLGFVAPHGRDVYEDVAVAYYIVRDARGTHRIESTGHTIELEPDTVTVRCVECGCTITGSVCKACGGF